MKKSNIEVFKEIEKKRPRALNTLTNRALKGDGEAAFHLAFVYFKNLTEEPASHGVKWLKTAVSHNNPEALFTLGVLYLNGYFIQQNTEKGNQLITLASHAGCLNAQAYIATEYLQNTQLNHEGLNKKLTEISTKNGTGQGLYNLAYCALNGIIEPVNKEKAIELFHKASEQNYVPAYFALATLYFEKNSPHRNFEKAFNCMLKAAEMGHIKACNKIAACYYGGIHTEQNLELAYIFWTLSHTELPPYLQKWVDKSGDGYKAELNNKVQTLQIKFSKLFIEKLHSLPY